MYVMYMYVHLAYALLKVDVPALGTTHIRTTGTTHLA